MEERHRLTLGEYLVCMLMISLSSCFASVSKDSNVGSMISTANYMTNEKCIMYDGLTRVCPKSNNWRLAITLPLLTVFSVLHKLSQITPTITNSVIVVILDITVVKIILNQYRQDYFPFVSSNRLLSNQTCCTQSIA